MINQPIYLDNNASTLIDPHVLDAMLPYFSKHYGNPSSTIHNFGLYAERAIEHERKIFADVFSCNPSGIIFTSGATESINMVIKGVVESLYPSKNHIIATEIEHPAVLETFAYLSKKGIKVSLLPVNEQGFIDLHELESAILPTTALVCIIAAHNEVGTIQNVEKIAQICRSRGVLTHFDYAQAAGKIPLNFQQLGADFISIAAHKNHGPKGIGALITHEAAMKNLVPLMHGGGQETGLRSGTLNVPLIVGLVKCFSMPASITSHYYNHVCSLWRQLYDGLIAKGNSILLNGPVDQRLCTNFSFYIPNVAFAEIQKTIPKVAFSGSGACSTNKSGGSKALRAMGFEKHRVENSVRFGLSRFTTQQEIDFVIKELSLKLLEK